MRAHATRSRTPDRTPPSFRTSLTSLLPARVRGARPSAMATHGGTWTSPDFSIASTRVLPPGPREERRDDPDDHLEAPGECDCAGKKKKKKKEKPGTMKERRTGPREAGWFTAGGRRDGPRRPMEEGWFTGDWYTDDNTIICDGSGSLEIHEATNYSHGVQECTRLHEAQHRRDWYERYGDDICEGRDRGDLPHFDPEGEPAYAEFKDASECAAWRIGRDCRQEKLEACENEACEDYVQPHVDWANDRVSHYCD